MAPAEISVKYFSTAARSLVRASSSRQPMRLIIPNKLCKLPLLVGSQLQILEPRCNVFINHRGADTKKNVAGLLYDYLRLSGYDPFLDEKTMKPGEKMPDTIDHAIRQCKMSIGIFSPRYCESIHCLNELILMLETGKRLLPIFVDIKPSELMVSVLGKYPHSKQFHLAIKEAINTVGLTFDSTSGDWPKLMRDALEAVEWNFSDLTKVKQA